MIRLSLVVPAISVILSLAPRPAMAYRPFDGTDAQVAGKRLIEVEMGPLGYVRTGNERLLVAPQTVFNYGLGAGFEIVLEGRRVMLMSPAPEGVLPRFDENALSIKKLLRRGGMQDGHGPSVATEESALLPPIRGRGAGGSASLIVSQRLSKLTFHLNGEIARTREHVLGRFGSVIVEGSEHWQVRPIIELSVEREGSNTATRGLLFGLIWQTRQGLTMDGAILTADGDERALEVRTGFTWKMQLHPKR